MTKKPEKYKKILEVLIRSDIRIDRKEQLKAQILQKIETAHYRNTHTYSLLNTLFGWAEVWWIRWSVSALTIILIGSFLIQQIGLNQRISILEKQLYQFETVGTSDPAYWNAGHKLFMKLYSDSPLDSITVSKSDLNTLMVDYGKLIEAYKALNPEFDVDQFLKENNIRRQTLNL